MLTRVLDGRAVVRTQAKGARVRLLLSTLWIPVAVSHAAAQTPLSVVAISGTPVPGSPELQFRAFGVPAINAAGNVAFTSTIAPSSSGATTRGIWTGTAAGLRAVALVGDIAPTGFAGEAWTGLNDPTISNIGTIGFRGTSIFGSRLRFAIYNNSEVAGTILVADNADHSPPLLRVGKVSNLTFQAMSSNGISLIYGGISGGTSSTDAGMWSGVAGALSPVTQTGAPLPGATPFIPASIPSDLSPIPAASINASGTVVFAAQSSTSVSFAGFSRPDFGYWISKNGVQQPLIRIGQPAPGMPAGTLFDTPIRTRPSINDAGQMLIPGTFRQRPGGGNVEGSALWRGLPDALTPVIYAGQLAPGVPPTPGGALPKFGSFVTYAMGGGGDVVVSANLSSSTSNNDSGVWVIDRYGAIKKVVVEYEPIPRTTNNVFFQSFQPSINAPGTVAFLGLVGINGMTTFTGNGLFAMLPGESLQSILLPGDTVTLSPGDTAILKNITAAAAANGEDGLRTALNDLNQYTLHAEFTDGRSAILVVGVPAPGSLAVLLAAGLCPLMKRRRLARQ